MPQGLKGYKRAWLSSDVIAGITLAAVAIPECMGYTKIAGTPVITGLYTILLPVLAFAILGSSKHLVVGADSATAAILFGGLMAMAQPNSGQWLALSSTCALVTGALLFLADLLRLGFLSVFMSRTVLVGFLSGVGVSLVIGELPDMLGIEVGRAPLLQRMPALASHLGGVNLATVAVACGVVAVILLAEKFAKKVPGALVAVALAILLTWALHLERYGLSVVGAVKTGLPTFGLPLAGFATIIKLLPICASMFLVILAQSAATSRSFAQKHNEPLDEDRDLLGLAAANVMAGLSGSFVVNGSPTKTAVADSAGARTQAAQVTMAAVVLIVLLFATASIAHLPNAALAGLVFLIGIKLVDIGSLRQIWSYRKITFAVAILTLLAVVFLDVERGILVAILLSVLDHLRQEYRPKDVVLVSQRGKWRPVPANPGVETLAGLIVYRFDAPLFFANADHFSARLKALRKRAPHPLKWLILDMVSMNDIDYTASVVLQRVTQELQKENVTVALAEIADVEDLIRKGGVADLVGKDHIFESVQHAIEAFENH